MLNISRGLFASSKLVSSSLVRSTMRGSLLTTAGARFYSSERSVGSVRQEYVTSLLPENNIRTETNMLEKGLSKFWEKVSIRELTNGDFAIQLDDKTIKTPAGNPLIIPASKKPLAHMIVQEWTVLPSLKIKNFSLPLTSLSSRAIDTRGDREIQTSIIEDLMPYLDTDTLVVFSPTEEWDGRLRAAQEKIYRPIISEIEQFWGVKLTYMDSDLGVIGNRQTPETKQKVCDWLMSLDEWQLTAVERTTLSAKSIIAATNIIRRQMTISEVAEAVGLETKYQTERWGEVEDTHDVDYADIRRHLGSSLFLSYVH